MKTLSLLLLALISFAGGSPSKGTKADKRLKENKPKPVMPVKKGGK